MYVPLSFCGAVLIALIARFLYGEDVVGRPRARRDDVFFAEVLRRVSSPS